MQPAGFPSDAEESHCVAKSIRAIMFFLGFLILYIVERRTKEASCMGAMVALFGNLS